MKKMLFHYRPGPWCLGLLLVLGTRLAAVAQTSAPYFKPDGASAQRAAASPAAQQLRQYRTYTLDLTGLRRSLAGASLRSAGRPLTVVLPQPDGTNQRFAVWEAPLLAPALAAQHPDVHTYGGQGLDNPAARLSLTVSPTGLTAQILTDQSGGAVYLEAVSKDDTQHLIGYYAQDVLPTASNPGECGTNALPTVPRPPAGRGTVGGRTSAITQPIGPTLTVFRLVIATTKEYTASVHSAANGTDSTDVLTNVLALINNVRTIQERDLAITMQLVNYKFYNNVVTGNYNNGDPGQMIRQNPINMETRFGVSSFDLGHVLSTTGSGVAYLGTAGAPYAFYPYNSGTVPTSGPNRTYKAGGMSGNGARSSPLAYYSTSVIAHEMGHQFNASHAFNGGCAANRSPNSAWEPGSGTTIMSYPDVGCGYTIQRRADPYYHTGSVDQMRSHVEFLKSSYNVGTTINSGNNAPTVTVPANKTIPQGTPFKLTAVGADADAADALAYNWDELDTGSLADVNAPQVANDNWPLFRSIYPSASGATRYFPRLSSLGGSPTTSTDPSERLPTVARLLRFKCSVRDYHSGTGPAYDATTSGIVGGVVQSSLVTLTVSAANGTPFAVTVPTTGLTWGAGSTQTVTWNGVGTKSSAVNCQTVNIRLSTDGGATYPTLLAAGVPNADGVGSARITVPAGLNTTTARIMVEAADNYFFDISDTNFSITTGPVATALLPTSGPVGTALTIKGENFGTTAADLGVTFTSLTGTVAGTITAVTDSTIQVTVPVAAVTGPVVVTRTGTVTGTTSPGTFSVTPVVSSLSPTSGAEGSVVTLTGTGLGGASRVSFNGAVVQSTSFTSTNYTAQPNTITLTVPVGATTGPVVVTTAGGDSNPLTFTVTSFTFSPLALSPASGTGAASETTPIVATLNAAPDASATTTAPLRVSSLQAGGRLAGTTSVSGNTIVFDPTLSTRAGEVVQVTLTTATTNAGTTLTRPYVGQYTTRTGLSSGLGTTVNYTAGVGTRPEYVVAGAVDADADLDMVVVNRTSNTVSILLNNGTGTGFTAATGSPIAVGTTPVHATLADLNNDGNLDLLVACASGTVNILQGNGDGTFTAQASLTGLGTVGMTAVGDLNGDGNLDVVIPVGTSSLARAIVGLANADASGNGNFTFTTRQYNGLGTGAQTVVLADFNEDGKLDLASANNSAGTVSVRFGDGAGSFTGTGSLAAAGINHLVTADLTGDGHLDLASANPYNTSNSNRNMLAWIGGGDGTFGSPIRLTPAVYTYTLSTGDYDGDGLIDLMAARSGSNAGGADIFSYKVGSGTGAGASFTGPVSTPTIGAQTRSLALVDLNNDRTLDFVSANSVGANSVSVALGKAIAPAALTWTGAVSADWFAAGNWSPARVPLAGDDATITSGPTTLPLIDASTQTAVVRNLTIDAGATLRMNDNLLDVQGDLTNNGTFQPLGGTIALGNTAPGSVLGSSATRFWNLTVGASGAQTSTSASTSVRRLLALNGNFTTNGNPLTLESDATGTAMVANTGSNAVSGSVTVQRYISGDRNAGLGYHHLSSPVRSATVGSLATARFTPVVNPAYNASAQPGTVTPFPTVYGYDQSRLATATNNLATFDKGWFSPAALSDALAVGQGYAVNLAGGQTLSLSGPATTGTVPLNLARNTGPTATDAGLALVGNPYPSPLDWAQVLPADRPGLDGVIYVFTSTDPSNPYTGAYDSYNNGVGTLSPVLPLGQAFFVRVTPGQTAATLTFKNSHRPTTYASPTYRRTSAETRPLVQLTLQGAGRAARDAAFVYFEQGATEGFDPQYDAVKMANPNGLNLSASVAGQQFSIDGYPTLGAGQRVVPLAVGVPAAGSYSLAAAQLLNLGATPVYLRDLHTGAVIDLRQQPNYQFTVSNAAALLTTRFELVFSPQQALATAPAALAQQVALYPNPAKKAAFVELPASLGRQAITAVLVDVLGRAVRTVSLPAQGALAHQLDLSQLAAGVYALRLTTGAGLVIKKLVIE